MRDRRGNAIIIGAGQLGLRVVQVNADVGHSLRFSPDECLAHRIVNAVGD